MKVSKKIGSTGSFWMKISKNFVQQAQKNDCGSEFIFFNNVMRLAKATMELNTCS
jgi:hypothetical protein